MPHKKSHKRKTVRRKQKSGFYGAVGAIAPGAMQWSAGSEKGGCAADMSGRGGNNSVQYGRGRRGSKKAKRSTRRKHRGGGKFGGVSASFAGTGSRGLADYTGVITRTPVGSSSEGNFNNFAYSATRGSSFVRI